MENEELSQEPQRASRWLWFLGGCALSVTTLCSVVLFLLLVASASLNAYLAWTMSGYEVSVNRPVPTVLIVITPTAELALVPPAQSPAMPPAESAAAVNTPTALQAEFATLAAIATEVAASQAASTPGLSLAAEAPGAAEPANPAPQATPAAPAPTLVSRPESGEERAAAPGATATPRPAANPDTALQSAAASSNTYTLIPIEGGRESRPADQHADLNLKLREPQPADFDTELVEISGSGIDPNAPQLSSVFEPDFVRTYAVHDWDWGCNCKGGLMQDGRAVLAGIRTTPGEPVFIPRVQHDIFLGKYYATVLYASEDSLTFVYRRGGNVASGYTLHYLGLKTDPDLVKLFRESEGSELPGLTLDAPVGVATDELIVAVRDNGTFLDTRSKRDWWN
jgi:hypothetical protein